MRGAGCLNWARPHLRGAGGVDDRSLPHAASGRRRRMVRFTAKSSLSPYPSGTEEDPAPIHFPSEVASTFTDGEEHTWTVESGALGPATQTTDPAGLATQYDRDADGHPLGTTRPSGTVVTQTFDANG